MMDGDKGKVYTPREKKWIRRKGKDKRGWSDEQGSFTILCLLTSGFHQSCDTIIINLGLTRERKVLV